MTQNNSGRKLAAHPFFNCNAEGEALFEVRAGIKTEDALDLASCILAAAKDVATGIAQGEKCNRMWGVVYLLQMSKAVVDAAVEAAQTETADSAKSITENITHLTNLAAAAQGRHYHADPPQ